MASARHCVCRLPRRSASSDRALTRRVFRCISCRLRTSPRVSSFASFGVVGSGPHGASLRVHFRSLLRVTRVRRASSTAMAVASSDWAFTKRVFRCISGRLRASLRVSSFASSGVVGSALTRRVFRGVSGPVRASSSVSSSASFGVVGSGLTGRVCRCMSGRVRASLRVSQLASFGVVGSGPHEASFPVHSGRLRASLRVSSFASFGVVGSSEKRAMKGRNVGWRSPVDGPSPPTQRCTHGELMVKG